MGILERAAAAAQSAELYEELSEGIGVTFRGGEIEKASSQTVLGRALRVIAGGRLGFASTAGEDEEKLVEAALTSANHGDPAPFGFPPLRTGAQVEVLDEEVLSISPDELISWGEEAVRAIREEFPEVIVDASLSRGTVEVRIENTSGGSFASGGPTSPWGSRPSGSGKGTSTSYGWEGACAARQTSPPRPSLRRPCAT
jgi:PmbA protein